MARSDKAAAVAELTDQFRNSNAAVLTEYRGLSVAQLKTLRRNLDGNAQYFVVKNTLTKIAAKQAGVDAFDSLLRGPSAIAFVSGDAVEVAKGLRDFAKANPMLVIKGGVLEGKSLTPAEIAKLADLESREVLLAKLAGAMIGSLSQAAALFQAPLSKAARTLDALRAQVEATGGPAEEPAAEEPAAAKPVEEAAPIADAAEEAVAVEEASAEAVAESPVAAEDPVAEVPAAPGESAQESARE